MQAYNMHVIMDQHALANGLRARHAIINNTRVWTLDKATCTKYATRAI